MKRLLFISTILLCCLPACSKDNNLPSRTSTAMKMYEKYSSRKDLNVAMIGNYCKEGNTYDALMLHALTDVAWDSLMAEFGIEYKEGFDQIKTLTSTRKTTASDIDDVEGLAGAMVDLIMEQVRGEMKCSKTLAKESHTDSVRRKSKTKKASNEEVLDTMAAVKLKNGLMSGIFNSLSLHIDEGTAQSANEEGKTGYVVHMESQERTIWLFFYDSDESYDAIMRHVKGGAAAQDRQ